MGRCGVFRTTQIQRSPRVRTFVQWDSHQREKGSPMVHPARTSSRTTRKLTVSALAAAITLALGAPHAQVRVEAQSTEIRGRAPVVTIGSVDNETVAGQAPAVGHTLKAHATVVDPDDDAITGTTYKWKRDATEIGTGEEYATTPADAGKTLTVEVTATTDAAITDPAMGSATRDVVVAENTAPTVVAGSVSISGIYAVGETLTATYQYDDADKDAEDESGAVYSWFIGNPTTGAPTLIEGATGLTYTLRPSDQGVNRRIWFSVDKVKSVTGSPNERLRPTSPAGQWQASRRGDITGTPPVAAPTITGTVALNQQLTALPNVTDVDDDIVGGSTYQWYRADDAAGITNRVAIAGATGETYTITADDSNKYLVFEVVPRTTTGTPNVGVATSTVTSIAVPATAPTAAPTITGTLKTNEVLTGVVNYDDAEDDAQGTHLYQWYTATDAAGTNRTPISGATSDTYALTGAEQGKYLVFEVTPVSVNAPTTGIAYRAVSALVPGNAPYVDGTPTLTGTWAVGEEITGHYQFADADNDVENPDGATFTWFISHPTTGVPIQITGATGRTLTLRKEDQGTRTIWFRVNKVVSQTGTPNEGNRVPSPPTNWQVAQEVTIVGTAPTAAPTITGTVAMNQPLTGEPNITDVDNDTIGGSTFQWYRADDAAGTANRVAISGATSTSYMIADADAGKYLVFEVVPRTSSGTPNVGVAASAVTSISVPATAPTAAPTITGTLKTGDLLTGAVNYSDAEDDAQGTHLYQWYTATDAAGTNRTPIVGATSDTYTLTGAEQGKYIVFEVTPVSVNAPTSGVAYRAVSALVPATAPNVPAGTVSITGTYAVGEELTGHWGYEDADGDLQDEDGVQLTWHISHPTTGVPTVIPGATGKTYTLKASDQGANRRIWFSV